MKWLIVASLAFLGMGCVYKNECGYSTKYYNQCTEYYDSMGIYHKDCPDNDLVDQCQQPVSPEDCLNCN